MTYQMILRGAAGMVIASDQCERVPQDGASQLPRFCNLINKIKVSPDGKYAWAFAGGNRAKFLSEAVLDRVAHQPVWSDAEMERTFNEVEGVAEDRWKGTRQGPDLLSGDSVILACGPSKKIFRRRFASPKWSRDEANQHCIAGLEWNQASFMIDNFYRPVAGVDELASLASYTIRRAHDLDTNSIDGLDVYVYRDSKGQFERADADLLWRRAGEIHESMRQFFRSVI